MKDYGVLFFESHFSAQRTVAQNIRSESDATFSASSKIAFIKNSEVFRGSSSSLEALTCFISFRAVTRHFWWRPASFLLRNPIPIALVTPILTNGRFPSIRNPLSRSTASISQLILKAFHSLSNGSVQIPFLVKFPEFSFCVQKIRFWGFNLFGNIVHIK